MKLQRVHTFAAKIAFVLRNFDHISKGLKFLGCLDKSKSSTIVYVIMCKFLNDNAPEDRSQTHNRCAQMTLREP